MWTARREHLAGGRILKVGIDRGPDPVPFSEVLRLWRDDEGFRTFFNGLLADARFAAFRWETPPVTASTVGRPFECVILDSPGLDSPGLGRRPDPGAFEEHLGPARSGPDVVAFPNLGRDAILIVPRPVGPTPAYGHLATFARDAPERQRHALWALVGSTMANRLGAYPVWLNTAGAGVPWLHVRLDDRPKYYGYGPYRPPV